MSKNGSSALAFPGPNASVVSGGGRLVDEYTENPVALRERMVCALVPSSQLMMSFSGGLYVANV